MGLLSDDDLARLVPSELVGEPTPLPTQIVASDEYFPAAQNAKQREMEARLLAIGETLAKRQGISRRRFFQTAAGMAAGFVAMNQTYGDLFAATEAEAATPELAEARAGALKNQFIMDMHTHFLRDDTRLTGFVGMREAVGKAGWNPELAGKAQTIADLKFDNYFKEIFLDSDTKVALISSAPSDIAQDWFLTNEMTAATREKVNAEAGSRRMFAHAIFTPGQPGWMEALEHAISLRPDSFKGYTIGDNTHKATSHFPWRMDDETLVYPAYQKMLDAGIRNVCVHKGLFPPSLDRRFPNLRGYADVSDVGQAARDWPQLNFIIYHSGYRHVGEGADPAEAMAEFDRTGRIAWVSDLADIPELFDVTNVYGDLGQLFANSTVAQPRLAAAVLGVLIKGMGADHVTWGTDAVWTGSPQWQIEGLRRLEIPEDMRRKYGFAPLGPAEGAVKTAIFSGNSARLYKFERHASITPADRFALRKLEYEKHGPARSNLRYGYVQRPA
jgi:predicted TIM-barrel fold metal-dependent hydrolase